MTRVQAYLCQVDLILYERTITEDLQTETYFVSDCPIIDETANGITEKLL